MWNLVRYVSVGVCAILYALSHLLGDPMGGLAIASFVLLVLAVVLDPKLPKLSDKRPTTRA